MYDVKGFSLSSTMSFIPPRRGYTSADAYRSASSSEEDHLTNPNPLSPPRPFFFAGDRSSWSTGENSDSERERESPVAPPSAGASPPKIIKTKHHGRHVKKSLSSEYAAVAVEPETPGPITPHAAPSDPFKDHSGGSSPRPPPSSFSFPFQAYPGNPDPIGPAYRRTSGESFQLRERPASAGANREPGVAYSTSTGPGGYQSISRAMATDNSSMDLPNELSRPYAPFMASGSGASTPPSPTGSSTNVYKASAAAALHGSSLNIPSSPSSFRAPFLSPSSRPSSIWQPPVYPLYGNPTSANGSNPSLPLKKSKAPLPSTRLPEKLTAEDKPWIKEKDTRGRVAWWLTLFFWFLGAAGGAVLCYFTWTDVKLLPDSSLCQVFSDDFDSFDTNIWTKDVELGGFGNGEFQMTTNADKNLYVQNSELYIYPTLTSDEIGTSAIFNNGNYTLSGCTTKNTTACTVRSNGGNHIVVNPVQSARISTINSYSIRYGKVEVKAKLPRGDWMWPAIWMLPVKSTYGPWPASGEIDLMEARGNLPSYGAQGLNYVRSSLNYGPFEAIMTKIYGWQSQKRSSYDLGFHTYTMEWTDGWMRISVDSKIKATLDMTLTGKGGKSFWDRGKFPATAQNGSTEVVVNNIYEDSPSAPYDQNFYLIIDLAVGGTSGWFPDGVGGKPWYDGSNTAMYDFAYAQDTWSATWPNDDDRAFRIDSVKMWSIC